MRHPFGELVGGTEGERLAYAAGLIDGEGCIGAYNTRPKTDTVRAAFFQLTVRVAMKTPRPVEFLYALFGGARHIQLQKGPGKPGPYFVWQARNVQAEECLRRLLPYLVEKREQAVVALEFGEFRRLQRSNAPRSNRYTPDMITAREVYVDQLKALKRTIQEPVWEDERP
jgi:hypothetical protein